MGDVVKAQPVLEPQQLGLVTDHQSDGITAGKSSQPRAGLTGRVDQLRGEHAHRRCHQLIIATTGAVSVLTDNGSELIEVRIDEPNIGVYLPPMVWGVQFRHTADAVLMVLASDRYDADDYIRDYDEFIREVS